jgi:hypothetical protein
LQTFVASNAPATSVNAKRAAGSVQHDRLGRDRRNGHRCRVMRDRLPAELVARSPSHQAVAKALHIELALMATPVGGFGQLLADFGATRLCERCDVLFFCGDLLRGVTWSRNREKSKKHDHSHFSPQVTQSDILKRGQHSASNNRASRSSALYEQDYRPSRLRHFQSNSGKLACCTFKVGPSHRGYISYITSIPRN